MADSGNIGILESSPLMCYDIYSVMLRDSAAQPCHQDTEVSEDKHGNGVDDVRKSTVGE